MPLRAVPRHPPLAVLGLRRPSPIVPAGARPGLAHHDTLLRCRCRCQGGILVARRYLHEDIARKNHYERLNLRHDATPAEIKKSFYSLSKTHHPDANPANPSAGHAFSLLSESYTILSNTSRRAAYDRDVLRLHHHQHHAHAHPNPRASYHSANNPAGGRSPSGLSRRRGTFRGPPPSFYRSGGWGNHADKRRQAHEESTGTGSDGHSSSTASSSSSHTSSSSSSAHGGHPGHGHHGHPGADPWASAYSHTHPDAHDGGGTRRPGAASQHGGMGPGDDPFGHQEEVPHFDKEGHTRTHRREDTRRRQRSRRAVGDDDIEFEPQTTMTGHFLIISGILIATLVAPLAYIQFMRLGRRTTEREQER